MGDGSLSQDEIDALLKGTDDVAPQQSDQSSVSSGAGSAGGGSLSAAQKGALTDMMNSVMAAVAPGLSGYLQNDLSIGNAYIESKDGSSLSGDFSGQYVQIQMGFNGGVTGQNSVLMSATDAALVAGLMMGQRGAAPSQLTEAHESMLSELIGTMLSSVATQISSKIGASIGTTPPDLVVANGPGDFRFPSGEVVKITYNFSIPGVLNSKIYHLLDGSLVNSLTGNVGSQQSSYGGSQQQMQMPGQVDIAPVKFPPLTGSGLPENTQNIGLLMDVQLTLTVELGRTKYLVKDVLGLGEGSIIELDKLAGEPVDLLVNGKLIAKGEVVVIDENFGVRVTDIVSPSERLTKMGGGS
ncbi:MAG: flagellar motor switch protein FliN [Spirochaetes bacterium]|nr:flagellar motor switch protein FliN [Spirochaetota bacterium]MBN2770891.1 flagellar motor switch protein FliN [Spirochaetota bacterium]